MNAMEKHIRELFATCDDYQKSIVIEIAKEARLYDLATELLKKLLVKNE
jgi:hypothetical protein